MFKNIIRINNIKHKIIEFVNKNILKINFVIKNIFKQNFERWKEKKEEEEERRMVDGKGVGVGVGVWIEVGHPMKVERIGAIPEKGEMEGLEIWKVPHQVEKKML